MAINQNDFITPIEGNIVILNNGARLVLTSNADANLGFEGDENFKLTLRKGSNTGPIVAVTSVLVVRDTSNTITYDSLVESLDTIAEGDTISFVLDTTNLGPNNTLYYSITGNAESSLFASGNTGSFVTTGNAYTLSFPTTATVPDNETRFLQLEIREDSLTGPVKITSNVVNIVDSLQAFISASGGFEIIEDNYKMHVFKSSNTFSVLGLGIPDLRTIEYLVVGGGGSAATSDFPSGTASGAGAGGFRTGNLTLTQADNYTVTVGSGGASGAASLGNPGNPSVFGNPGSPVFIESAGGGAGVNQQTARSGGSGGGASYSPVSPVTVTGGAGNVPPVSPPQGNPGGNSANVPTNKGAGGGGAGAAGTPAPSGGSGGIGRSINWQTPVFLSTFFGTPGPTPGRWFAGGGGRSNAAGGAGGGNAGPTAINTGGGGRGGSPDTGAPGIVILRYPYTVKTFNITDDLSYPDGIVQGSNVTYSLRTINVSNNSVLYYTTSGNVTTNDFFGGNTGSFTLVNANASFALSVEDGIVSGEDTKVFEVQIRENSITGPIVATSNTVTIYSLESNLVSTSRITATGGNVITEGGYNIHAFTTSGNLVISSVSLDPSFNNIEYLVVAGGGGGGGFASGPFGYAGGGGAGGLLLGNIQATLNTHIIEVGSGGAGAPNPTLAPLYGFNGGGFGHSGGNSSIKIGTSRIVEAVGGGFGMGGSAAPNAPLISRTGGSGGGNSGYEGPVIKGIGIPGQGNPGGSMPTYYGGGGGGAGQAGMGSPTNPNSGRTAGGHGGNGISISWVPPVYGTPGPTPGRWFAGGGAGHGGNGGAPPGNGGAGGGGGDSTTSSIGTGVQNTGGGGRGNQGQSYPPTNPLIIGSGEAGGSGIVIIRYRV